MEEFLRDLGVSGIAHVNGTFLRHLEGVRELLRAWSARESLCQAGLFHSVYGTAGFGVVALGVSERSRLSGAIGQEAEEIVYLFCACDREVLYARLRNGEDFDYRDRFTGEARRLKPAELRDLCELTMADQLELLQVRPPEDPDEYERKFRKLTLLRPYVTEGAVVAFERMFEVAEVPSRDNES
jgi:Domain of unknown function (DUF6817)